MGAFIEVISALLHHPFTIFLLIIFPAVVLVAALYEGENPDA